MNINFTMQNTFKHLSDPLLKNSIYIILSSVSNGAFGFLFWMIAAKIYSPSDVGIATALLSSMGLLVLLSRVGMDFSLIRFFPSSEKGRIFSTSAVITSFLVAIVGIIFIINIDFFSPELSLLKSTFNGTLFIVYLIANSLTLLIGIAFVSMRKAEYQFIQSLLMGSRVIFLVFLISFGTVGIFNSLGISFLLATLISIPLLLKCNITPHFVIDRIFLVESFHFSIGNYISSIFVTAPGYILPIMVLNILGAQAAAYYYISYAIAGLLFMIPNAISMSLFVEGSHGEALKKTVIKSILIVLIILVPISLILYVFSSYILGLVGADYASEGVQLFRVMIFSSFFVSLNYIYNSIQRILKEMKGIIIICGLIFFILIVLGYLFLKMYGVVGIGYAWLVSYIIGSIIFGVTMWKKGWI